MIICRFENGNDAFLRHVCVDNIVIKNNKILLVKRSLHLSNPGMWALVGGYVARDETIEQAAVREVLEETGYESKVEYLLSIKDSPKRPKEDRQNISFVYVMSAFEKIKNKDNESSEVKFFKLDHLPKEDEFAFDHYEDICIYKKSMRISSDIST